MSRGPWQIKQRKRKASVVAETASEGSIAVQLADPAAVTVDGLERDLVAYCGPDVDAPAMASMLRELADAIDGVF